MIKVEKLNKIFKTYRRTPGLLGAVKGIFKRENIMHHAVKDMSFTINEGEMVGYIGANGAGKSTTIKMISGILVPTSGKCEVNGIVPYENRKANSKQIGVVFGQRTQLWWDLPLTESYSILKEIYEVPDADYKRKLEFFKELLGIDEFISSPVRTLSLGQRMRADLAAALLHNPKVLYLDEPTIGLDIMVKSSILKGIRDINREFKTTVILTTHDLQDIEELCERIIIIDKGEKVYDGSIVDIKNIYGYMKNISIDTASIDAIKNIDLNDRLGLSNDDLKVTIDGSMININYNKKIIQSGDILSTIIKMTPVLDINIRETDIEDIVKNIYTNGIKKDGEANE